jgi:hypothetical protein
MRAYVMVTGAVFGLITAVHLWRMYEEPHMAKEPWFIALTALTGLLALWAVRLLRKPQVG